MGNMIRESARVIVKSTFKRLGLEVVHREQNASALIEEIYGERDLLLTNVEAEQLFRVVRSVSKVPGDIAEVGVYTGASSRIIREAEPLKAFHLFDTFAGLPAPSTKMTAFKQARTGRLCPM
jgi:hypothetical protein